MKRQRKLNDIKVSLEDLEVLLPQAVFQRVKKFQLRKEGYKTLTEFSHEIGVSKQMLSKVIKGERKFKDARNLQIEYLIFDGFIYVRQIEN